jgi:predicted kinase
MYLEKLKYLHQNMTSVRLTRVCFSATVAQIKLDVAFIAEQNLFRLFVGRQGAWVGVPIMPGYQLNPVLPYQDYLKLLKLMGADGQQGKFHSGAFFQELVDTLPQIVEPKLLLRPHIATQLFGYVDEPGKHFFAGFAENPKSAEVSRKNLEKTKFLLGQEAYILCRKLNMSSRWTENPKRSLKLLPELGKLRKEAGIPTFQPKHEHLKEFAAAPNAAGKPVKARVFGIICGKSGTGKTTLAREVIRQVSEMTLFDLDVITAPIVHATLRATKLELDSVETARLLNDVLRPAQYEMLMSLAYDLMSQGRNPLCVASFSNELSSPAWFQALASALAANNVELRVAVLTAEATDAYDRLKTRGEFWDACQLKNWKEMAKGYSEPDPVLPCTHLAVNTSLMERPVATSLLVDFFNKGV